MKTTDSSKHAGWSLEELLREQMEINSEIAARIQTLSRFEESLDECRPEQYQNVIKVLFNAFRTGEKGVDK